MKNILRSFILLSLTISSVELFAQPGCPAVNAGSDVVLPCGQTCANLNASVFSAAETNQYTVSQIAYNPPFGFTNGTAIIVQQDDIFSGVINLPFNFCFFGVVYNQIVVGSNGVISFNVGNAGQAQDWQINGPIPSAGADQQNAILGPWQDIDPTNQGQIHYEISGNYPCRSFEISWFQVPYYGDPNSVSTGSCNNPLFATNQIVIYETTNAIEMYIQQKQTCPGWNGGLAIQGIQSNNGIAYTVPGRNATQWTANNDAWRFTPSGASNTTIAWFDGGTQIGTGSSIQVCPTASQSYTAQAVYNNCDGTTTTVNDDVFVAISGITINIDSAFNPTCSGVNNGSAYASFTSTGSAVLSYGWSPPGLPNQTSITGIGAGTYVFSVTDATNCTQYDTVTLVDPGPLVVTVPDSTAYSCNPNIISGALSAYVTGGDGNYTYLWNDPSTSASQTVTNLQPGTYTVVVNDGNGCTGTDSGILDTTITPPVFNSPDIQNVLCTGDSNGIIVVHLGQSTEPISYVWTNGLPDNDTVTGLPIGTYSVVATDANGCTASAIYTVIQPTPLVIGSPTLTQVTCSAGGTATVTASGGTPTYTYIWSNGDTGNFADSLALGSVQVTVTDANLCSATAVYTITNAPDLVVFGQETITNVLCNGASTGSITATASGGTAPIGFNWGFQTGPTITGQLAGSYSVTITDVNGCSASTTYNITEPSAIVIDSAVLTEKTCLLGGSICVYAHGGTGTLTYVWSNAPGGNCIDSLEAGVYILTITDANSCSVSATYNVVAAPGVVFFGLASITNNSCNGDSLGCITISPQGGTGTILIHWSNNSAAGTRCNLAAGSYDVTITDQVGCSATATYGVNEPAAIIPNLTFSQLICFGDSSGTACATPTGGAGGPYTYRWSNPASSTTQCISGLERGIILVTVTDAAQCSAVASAIIQQTEQLSYVRILDLHLCDNPPYGDLTITVRGGTGDVEVNVAGVGIDTAFMTRGDSTVEYFNVLTGNYTFTMTDSLGCTETGTFFVPQSAGNDNFDVLADSTSCFGSQFTDGAITITPLSSNGPYSYDLGNGFQGSNVFTNLTAGTYTVVIKNSFNCLDTVTAVVGAPLQVFANASPDTIITAPGVGNAIVVTDLNFEAPIYTWTPTSGLSCADCNNPTATVDVATVFYVTVSENEANNCSAIDSVVIIVSGGFRMPNAFSPNKDGRNDEFGPYSLGFITIKGFRIYNRWGQMVHDKNVDWSGTFKGEEQPAGTYVYYIEVDSPDPDNPGAQKTEKQQGSFTLLR